jgi:hypothetical protein
MHRTVLPSIVLAVLAIAPARAAEGPFMTAARELDLAAHHLAATAQKELEAGKVSRQAAETAGDFALIVRDFRFALEADRFSTLGAEIEWAVVADGFAATRDILHDSEARNLRHGLLRVHALMNRIDRGFGGSGFWSGPRGWSG